MEIQGRIISVCDARSGQKQNGDKWTSQEYVIETSEQYPKRVCFQIWGEDKIKAAAVCLGKDYKVSFDINAREYQGRWYNTISAWKVEAINEEAQPAPAQHNDPILQATEKAVQAVAAAFDAVPVNGQSELPF